MKVIKFNGKIIGFISTDDIVNSNDVAGSLAENFEEDEGIFVEDYLTDTIKFNADWDRLGDLEILGSVEYIQAVEYFKRKGNEVKEFKLNPEKFKEEIMLVIETNPAWSLGFKNMLKDLYLESDGTPLYEACRDIANVLEQKRPEVYIIHEPTDWDTYTVKFDIEGVVNYLTSFDLVEHDDDNAVIVEALLDCVDMDDVNTILSDNDIDIRVFVGYL